MLHKFIIHSFTLVLPKHGISVFPNYFGGHDQDHLYQMRAPNVLLHIFKISTIFVHGHNWIKQRIFRGAEASFQKWLCNLTFYFQSYCMKPFSHVYRSMARKCLLTFSCYLLDEFDGCFAFELHQHTVTPTISCLSLPFSCLYVTPSFSTDTNTFKFSESRLRCSHLWMRFPTCSSQNIK